MPALAAPNPSDSFERERSGHVLRWSRIAPAREELRNASNKNEHEPTSDRSTNYGNGHLIRVFRDIERISSWLIPLPGGPQTRHPFVTCCRRIVQSRNRNVVASKKKMVSNEFRGREGGMTKAPTSHGPQMHLRGMSGEAGCRSARRTITRGGPGPA